LTHAALPGHADERLSTSPVVSRLAGKKHKKKKEIKEMQLLHEP
jgi:hypothetical protein